MVVETDPASFTGIKSAVSIEIGTINGQFQALHPAEGGLQMRLQIKGVVIVARHNSGRGHHITVCFRDGQDVGSLGPFRLLTGHTLAAFLGRSVRAIQVQMRQIEMGTNGLNRLLPNPS